ncbi:ergothioneine biosynthesis protein EgtB [Peijinzhouia sedimentorum]
MLERFKTIRDYTVNICKPLEIEDHIVQPSMDVSPPKWHLAHTTWFFEEFILKPNFKNYSPFHPKYNYLFNSYYESMGERVMRVDRGNMSRPSVGDILKYRKYVDQNMIELIPSLPENLYGLLEIGFQHEQQHQELLLTDIKYILGHNPLFPAYKEDFKEYNGRLLNAKGSYLSFPEGIYEIGFKGNGFCFDNEKEVHKVFLQEFEIAEQLISNGEYLEFIKAGGYQTAAYWYSDAWAWVNQHKITSPLYWHQINEQWHRYSLAGLEPLPMNEPVTHISHYEAAAFAEWKGLRLPTEFEWEVVADKLDYGQRWEHTQSAYLAYPGYRKPAGAVGEYNGKFMINQMVLRGASIATPENHSRKTYRNFFHPQLQWQFTGIRLCKK